MSLQTWSTTRLSLTLLCWECVGLVIPMGVWLSAAGRTWLATHVIRGRPAWAYAVLGPPLTLAYLALWVALPLLMLLSWRWSNRAAGGANPHAAA